jgi:hypothetical protein
MSIMEVMEGSKPRARRSFTPEFKAEIVELCQRGDRSIGQVARDFDLTETAVPGVGAPGRTRRRIAWRRRVDQRGTPGAGSAAAGEPAAAWRCGGPEASHGFLREGDPVNVYPFIEAESTAVQRQARLRAAGGLPCRLLRAPRRHRLVQATDRDEELTEQIRQAHQASKGRYGAPRIHALLRRQGHRHGRTPRRFRRTTIPDPAAAARADLIRRDFAMNAAAVNTRWCGDITYVPTWEGWLYLATVLDIASRRVVGFALAEHLRTELVADALANAVAARDPAPGVIFHSDRGCQVLGSRGRCNTACC